MQQARVIRTTRLVMTPSGGWPWWFAARGILYLVVIILALVFGFPFFWTVSSSLKTAPELGVYPPRVLPAQPQWSNYPRVFSIIRHPVGRWFMNSLFVVAVTSLGTLISATLVAYGFARFRFRGKDLLFMVTLVTMMVPGQVTLIPQFILFNKLRWVNTFRPLWVPSWFGGGAFNIFLFRQFFLTLPMELDEAARIDGAGYWRTLQSVLLPLCKPVLATVAMISFMGKWGDFMGPLVYLNKPRMFTVALGLRYFHVSPGFEHGDPLQHILMAATVMSIVPCVVVFFVGQAYFVRGIVMSGIKG